MFQYNDHIFNHVGAFFLVVMKHKEPRLFEYRIKYNAGDDISAMNSYHYYMAETAAQAYDFHLKTMNRLHAHAQHLSVECRNPWSNRWEDASDVLHQLNNKHED